MAAASASMFVAFGPCRRKLQLLQPMAGVRPTPLFSACAAGAADRAATVISDAIRELATSARTSLLIGRRPPDSRHAAARPPFVAPLPAFLRLSTDPVNICQSSIHDQTQPIGRAPRRSSALVMV